MHKINFILFALLILLQFSCKKKETPATPTPTTPVTPVAPVTPQKKIDTIKPLPYLPAYPGSYWKYSDGNTYSTSATYKKDAYTVNNINFNSSTGSSSKYKSDTSYVTVYNNYPLWGYRAHNEGAFLLYYNVPSEPFVRIISDSLPIGTTWADSQQSHSSTSVNIVAKDSTISIAGKDYYPTIVLRYTFSNMSFNNLPYMRRYYTKNIGLIKEEQTSTDNIVTSEKHLVDYFINK